MVGIGNGFPNHDVVRSCERLCNVIVTKWM